MADPWGGNGSEDPASVLHKSFLFGFVTLVDLLGLSIIVFCILVMADLFILASSSLTWAASLLGAPDFGVTSQRLFAFAMFVYLVMVCKLLFLVVYVSATFG